MGLAIMLQPHSLIGRWERMARMRREVNVKATIIIFIVVIALVIGAWYLYDRHLAMSSMGIRQKVWGRGGPPIHIGGPGSRGAVTPGNRP